MQRSSEWRHASSVEWPAAALRSTILPGFNFGEGACFCYPQRNKKRIGGNGWIHGFVAVPLANVDLSEPWCSLPPSAE